MTALDVPLHPHMACINQPEEHVMNKSYCLVFTKDWLNNWRQKEEVCETHNSLKKMWLETVSGTLFLGFSVRKWYCHVIAKGKTHYCPVYLPILVMTVSPDTVMSLQPTQRHGIFHSLYICKSAGVCILLSLWIWMGLKLTWHTVMWNVKNCILSQSTWTSHRLVFDII